MEHGATQARGLNRSDELAVDEGVSECRAS